MEKKISKKSCFVAIAFFMMLNTAMAQPMNGVLATDILLDGKLVYRNYPKNDMSYKDWDKNSQLIDFYTDEESGTLYENKIKDSIGFRKGTTKKNTIKFWWFEILSPKHSIYIKSNNIDIHVGNHIDIIQTTLPDMWQQYQKIIKNEKMGQQENQLYTTLWFHFYEDSKELSVGSFQLYVKNGLITKVMISFMTEGDMP